MVGYRGEDDGAFFPIIFKIYYCLTHFEIDKLFRAYSIGEHFGYGWIFWIVSALFVMPGAIISHFFGIDNFLIAGVSILSLTLSFSGLFFFYKALSFYTKDELIKFAIIGMILMHPAFGYLSIKWHPTAFNFFFSCLLFYQLAKLEIVTKQNLRIIAITLAMSIGSKMTGLFMLPLVGLFLADRLKWQMNKENLIFAGYFFGVLCFFSVLFYDPSFFLFRKSYFIEHYKIISGLSEFLGQSSGCPQCSNPYYRINSVFTSFIKPQIIIFLLTLFSFGILSSFKNKSCDSRKYDLLYIFVCLGIVTVYLTYFVRYDVQYSFVPYFYTISFLVPIFLIIIANQGQIIKFLIVFILMAGNLFLNYSDLIVPYESYQKSYDCHYKDRGKNCKKYSFNYVRYRHHETYHRPYIDGAKNIKKIIGELDNYPKGLNLMMDFRVPTFYNPRLRSGVNLLSVFDNLNVLDSHKIKNSIYEKKTYNYIALFKHARILHGELSVKEDIAYLVNNIKNSNLSTKDKERIINQNQEMFSNWMESAKMIDDFLATNRFLAADYQKVYEDENFLLYRHREKDS